MIARGISAVCLFFTALIQVNADSFQFKADKLTGDRSTGQERTVLEGKAEVVSDSLTLKADVLVLLGENNRFIEGTGNVIGVDEGKGIRFETERLRYDRIAKVARLEGVSSLEDKENGVIARGRFIEYNDSAGTALLQIGVRLFKGELVCRSEYALYRREEQTLELSGLPVVYKDGDEFRADRISIDLETDEVRMEGGVTGRIEGTKANAESQ